MADVPLEPVQWLWRSRLGIGKLTILTGDGGMGKSRISIDIVARYSTGRPWPDGETGGRGTAVILSAEDHPGDTIRPALEVMGADLGRVAILDGVQDPRGDRLFNLQTDLAAPDFVTLIDGPIVPLEAVRLALAFEDRGVVLGVRDGDLCVGPSHLLTEADRVETRRWRDHLKTIATYRREPFQ
jgi:AAA domain